MNFRIGHGYDLHRLVEDRKLILGGVDIPYVKGLLGHSDADVALHALMDALLGALALGDIGKHFPDSDPAYKGISSILLLKKVYEIISRENYILSNADITIIAQKPKLLPYIPEMRKNIADAIGCDISQISVKATTEEGLGFTGSGEAISAHAVCILQKNI
ncbi:MAG: 2-C-methyl-D-erythritol 2,4-cyclodiphosphate synthase [Ruminococcaceae bacterium]|nr:2-C-methyl-D-erythritol 2,4-cyclodiphosphate synthase [Oscillospiraceae bacterium]